MNLKFELILFSLVLSTVTITSHELIVVQMVLNAKLKRRTNQGKLLANLSLGADYYKLSNLSSSRLQTSTIFTQIPREVARIRRDKILEQTFEQDTTNFISEFLGIFRARQLIRHELSNKLHFTAGSAN